MMDAVMGVVRAGLSNIETFGVWVSHGYYDAALDIALDLNACLAVIVHKEPRAEVRAHSQSDACEASSYAL